MAGKKEAPAVVADAAEKPGKLFSKGQLAASRRFRERRDILEALLDDGGLYTVEAVEEKIERYMKGKVE